MMQLARVCALVLAFGAAAPWAGARAQRPPRACRVEDSNARQLRAGVAFLLSVETLLAPPADSAFAAGRAGLGYARGVPDSAVVLVRDERVCRAAAAALARALAGPPRPARPPSGQVYVVRAGDTYTVLDLEYCYAAPSCLPVRVVFDRRWRHLSTYRH
jgi:hypothetical protein